MRFLYLPKHKILCTGDACVNGAYNPTTAGPRRQPASWVRVMEKAQQLDVKLIPARSRPARRARTCSTGSADYFVELRQQVQAGPSTAGKKARPTSATPIRHPLVQRTGRESRRKSRNENVEHVYGELTGRVRPWDLIEDIGGVRGGRPRRRTRRAGTKPKRIVVAETCLPTKLVRAAAGRARGVVSLQVQDHRGRRFKEAATGGRG